jgi:N-methylhydantoinase B
MHNVVVVIRSDGTEEQYMKKTGIVLKEGDVMSFRTAGGGGYGPPADREIERVAGDVIEGYISPQAAETDYGVVIGRNGHVDVDASRAAKEAA